MRVNQRLYEGLIFFLSLLNSFKIVLYGNRVFESISLVISLVILSFLFFASNLINIQNSILTVLCVIASLSITVLFNGGIGAAVNYLIIMFSSMLFSSYGISKNKIRFMFAVNGFILLLFLFLVKIEEHGTSYTFKTILSRDINPNTVGIISLLTFFFLFYVGINMEKKLLKICYLLIVFAVCLHFFIISECRSIFIALTLFCFLYTFKRTIWKEVSVRKTIFISQIISVLFVIFYIFLYRIGATFKIDIFGKSFFSGRQIVWSSAFKAFFKNPFFGSGNSVYLESVQNTVTASAHNTVMSILYEFGLIPTVCFYLFFGKKYDKKTIYQTCRFNQSVIISTLIITFFESFYMESYFGFLFMLFYIIEFVDIKDRKHQKIWEYS